MLTINPADTRKLIHSVRLNYNIDLAEFSFNLLRYRVSRYLDNHLVQDADSLINHLLNDENQIDEFLSGISAGSSELFRDPGMWNNLRSGILPQLFSAFRDPVFWLPRSVSGHDAYSLLILLAEEGFLNASHIFSSTPSFTDLKNVRSGKIERGFMNLNRENYLKAGGKKSIETYFNRSSDHLKPSFTRKIKFTRHYNMLHDAPGELHLIMIRNQLLNFTQPVKNHLLSHLTGMLPAGGILVLGAKELIDNDMIAREYESLVADESIYMKKS
jgi:chemotaxis protein methyltransferase CheR